MAIADYQVQVIHPVTGAQLDIVDARRIQDLRYNRKINDVGTLTLTVRGGDNVSTYKQIDNLILDVYRRNAVGESFQREDSFFASGFDILDDTGEDYVIFTGEGVLRLFRDRRILPEDDPDGANGYSTKSGIADLVMYDFVLDQAISPAFNMARAEPITNAASQNLGLSIFQRKSIQDTLLDTLQEAHVLGGVDFKLTRSTGATFIFEVALIGRNLTYTDNYPSAPFILYKPEFRNVKNPRFTNDYRKEKNIVYVGLQGIEANRLFVPISTPRVNIPFNRREGTIDAREIDDASLLNAVNTPAFEFLRENQPVIEFTFEIETSISRYNVDWFLGDYITAQYQDYRQDLRIEEVQIHVSKHTETIQPRFQQEAL